MARKDLLKALMETPEGSGELTAVNSPPASPAPRMTKGAIGAVSQQIAELRNRSIIEVPSDLIDEAGLIDRLDPDPEGIATLAESLRDYGQQVPVLLRHSPNHEGRYEVVYGRRRVTALRQLGHPVKAMVRDLSDHDMIVAQGQENAQRKDLSFIEKVNFARQMRDGGFERKVICDAIAIDKTLISRMLSIADALPSEVIRAIGAAPGIGRDRWLTLASRSTGMDPMELVKLAQGPDSDSRFEAVLTGVTFPSPTVTPAASEALKGDDGREIGQVLRGTKTVTLTFSRKKAAGFEDWLAENIDRLHRDWLNAGGK